MPAGLKTILYGQPVIPAYGTDDSQSETCRPLGRGLRMIESREYPAAVERRVPGIRYAETAPVHTDRHFRTGRAVQESVFEKIHDDELDFKGIRINEDALWRILHANATVISTDFDWW